MQLMRTQIWVLPLAGLGVAIGYYLSLGNIWLVSVLLALSILVWLSPFVLCLLYFLLSQAPPEFPYTLVISFGEADLQLADVVLLICIGKLLLSRFWVSKSQATGFKDYLPAVLFVAWGIIAQIHSLGLQIDAPWAFSMVGFGRLITYFVISWVFYESINTPERLGLLLRLMVLIGVVHAVFSFFLYWSAWTGIISEGVVEVFYSEDYARSFGSEAFRVGGFLGNQKAFSMFLLFSILLVFNKVAARDGGLRLLGRLGVLAIFVLALGLTRARSSMLAVTVGLSVMIFFLKQRRLAFIVLLVALTGLFFNYGYGLIESEWDPEMYGGSASSIGVRMDYWRSLLPVVEKSWLTGIGWGYIGFLPGRTFGPVTHNSYLEILVSFGVFGLSFFLWFQTDVLRRAVKLSLSSKQEDLRRFGIVCFCGLGGATIIALMDIALFFGLGTVYWVFTGLCLRAYRMAEQTGLLREASLLTRRERPRIFLAGTSGEQVRAGGGSVFRLGLF